ncbi:MAG TPA: glycosyltransferase [Phycisphaerae bacterium]|nr:glycosyltransferase [Phycisphaerae bacterium]
MYVDSEALAAPLSRIGHLLTLGRGLGWTTKQALMLAPYLHFEYLVFQRFRRALQRGDYDLIHRLTPLTPTYPSPLASWASVPFVLGPLNGGLPWPRGTTRIRLAEMEWLSYVRRAYVLLPYLRATYQRAALVIGGSIYTFSALPRDVRQRAVYMPENGIDPARFNARGRVPPSEILPFRILFVGRLVPYKGADVLIETVGTSSLLHRKVEVVIVGDGPMQGRLRRLADDLHLTDRVRFTGNLPQDQVAAGWRDASLFAFPSRREFGGAVVIEAMACGLPSVVLDYGGPAEHVTANTGFKIPIADRPQRIAALQSLFERLCTDPAPLDEMSAAGIDRIRRLYTWPTKARQIARWYSDVLQRRSRCP